jgi:hypothetical protein
MGWEKSEKALAICLKRNNRGHWGWKNAAVIFKLTAFALNFCIAETGGCP